MKKSVVMRLSTLALAAFFLCLNACGLSNGNSDTAKDVSAVVVSVEKYGHVVLDVTAADLASKGYALGDVVCLRFESFETEMPYYDGYYSNPGEMMLRGNALNEQIAVCINYGNFSEEKGITVGDTVVITLKDKAAMLAVQNLCDMKYTNNRADYADDASFANFRAVSKGTVGNNKLFRSASPINNEYGRASYACQLIADAGVATVLNLSDSTEDIEAFLVENGLNLSYYSNLYNSGKVMALGLGNNFYTKEFAEAMARGLTFLAQNDPPYSIHCTEGKDRSGFAAMLLEALMGAELDELFDDYMISYSNYYGISKTNDSEKYQTALDINFIPLLYYVTGVGSYDELTQIDLEAAVTDFLIDAGMKAADVATLKEKLS